MKSRVLHLLGIPEYHPEGFSRVGRQTRLYEGGGAEILYSDIPVAAPPPPPLSYANFTRFNNLIAPSAANTPTPEQWERILGGEEMLIGDTYYGAEREGARADIDNWSEGTLTGRVSRTPAGSNQYQMLGPNGVETFEGYKSKGFLGDMFSGLASIVRDTAPVWTAAIGMGPLGGMLGGAAASGLGITGLSAAQTAALGSAIAGGANTALQGGDIGDVLKGAFKTALPSFILPQIPSTGTPALDTAIKAGTQAAIRGGDIESVVVGSLLNSGIGAAAGETGLDPKLVNSIIQVAQSGGDPQKLFNAAVGAAGSFAGPNSQAAVGGGAETEGFFDAEEAQAVQDDINSIIARYPEQAQAPNIQNASYVTRIDPLQELRLQTGLTPDNEGFYLADLGDTPPPAPTPITAPERNAFLEANIPEPETVQQLMQEYYPEIYRTPVADQRVEVTGTREVPIEQTAFEQFMQQYAAPAPVEPPGILEGPSTIEVTGTRNRDLFPEFTQPLLTAEPAPEPIYEQPPTPAPGPTAPPAAAPAPAPPAAAPSPAPKAQSGTDMSALFALLGMMNQPAAKADPYQVARIQTRSPFGNILDEEQPSMDELLQLIGRG